MEKINDIRVQHTIFDDLHMVIYMSINPSETIDYFKGMWEKEGDWNIWMTWAQWLIDLKFEFTIVKLVREFTFNIGLSFLIIMQIQLLHSFGYSLNNITFIF